MDSDSDSTITPTTEPSKEKKSSNARQMLIPNLAKVLCNKYNFAVDVAKDLYCYGTGVYEMTGAEIIERFTKKWLSKPGMPLAWSTHFASELIAYIAVDAPKLLAKPDDDKINLLNGLYDTTLMELYEHTPTYLTTVQIPIKYDESAQCPHWRKFAKDVLTDDCYEAGTLWEVIAWLMTSARSQQKSLWVLGSASSGKSTFFNALRAFLSRQNVHDTSLIRLQESKFEAQYIMGKLACMCSDMPDQKLRTIDTFKNITGNDPVMAERKHGARYNFISFAKLVMSSNLLIKSFDTSEAWYRRFYVLPLERNFEDNPAIGRRLEKLLSDPKELSGVFNEAIKVLPRVLDNGITETPSMKKALAEFQRLTDPLSGWLDTDMVKDGDGLVPKTIVYESYRVDTADTGQMIQTQQAFGRAVKKLRPFIQETHVRIGDKQVWCYRGIRFSESSLHFSENLKMGQG